ncbi:MAG TPA: hypothetical protein VGI43_14505 [Mucilaginibacter sp.]|jgi:general stress protein CsbA
MKEEEIQDELVSIRKLMERSSKFISLSGLSGILAGVYALIGAGFAYYVLYYKPKNEFDRILEKDPEHANSYGSLWVNYSPQFLISCIAVALLVLIASLVTGYILTSRKAKKNGQPIWGKTSQVMLFHLATPLATGGILILIFSSRGYFEIIAPLMLIFYGLALISAGNFTFNYIKYLGICEIVLGLIAACLPGYGLLFWAIGFGLLHIIYGSMVYFKYDR